MHPPEMDMSAVAFVERAAEMAAKLEDDRARRDGLFLVDARPLVAREIGVSPGTFENLRRGRLKDIGHLLYSTLQRAMMRRLQAELRRIEHEIGLLTAQGADPLSNQMAAALADDAAVRRALGLSARAPVAPVQTAANDR